MEWPKYVTVVLTKSELDYLAGDAPGPGLQDDIRERLLDAWDSAESLSPAQKIALDAYRRRKEREVKGSEAS